MRVQQVVETEGQLEDTDLPPFLHGIVHRFIAKPFYFRWRSQVDGWVEIGDQRIPLQGETVHEQMILRGRLPH